LTEPAAAEVRTSNPKDSSRFSLLRDGTAIAVLIGIVVYAALRNLIQAPTKTLWFDELLTELISSERGVSGVWKALKTAVDSNPPPFYLIEKLAGALSHNELVAYRLPSIVAFSFTLMCVYAFVRRRSGPIRGLLCASVLLVTPLFWLYADEARPYSMLLACIAFAMVCYQRAPGPGWTLGLFLSLTVAMSLHYYAMLAFVPFFTAEFFFALQAKRLRLGVWAALLLALAPLVVFWPFLAAMKAYYGSHLWGRAQWMDVARSYGEFFRIDTLWGVAVAGLLGGAVLGAMFGVASPEGETREGREESPAQEDLLVLGFLGYSAIVVIFAKVTHGLAAPRYFLVETLGVAVALRYVLDWFRPRALMAVAAFLLLALATQELSFWSALRSTAARAAPATSLLALVDSAHQDDLPVVIADPGEYFELLHFAAPELKRRIVTVVDPPSAVQYLGTDSVDKVMLALRQITPLDVDDFSNFAGVHHSFLVYSNGSSFEWLPLWLQQHGEPMRVVAAQGRSLVYFVQIDAKN
jgi:hypothetical protein